MTKKFDHLRNLTASITPKEDTLLTTRPKTAPVLTAEATKRLHDAEARAATLELRLKEALENGIIVDINLDRLYAEPGRKRTLEQEQYNRLLENLRHNDLVTPIIVRKMNDGRYEIVSGHNRTQAFKDLGRSSIPAIVADIANESVGKDAFYANLLHSTLPDYEKYLGFQRELDEHPNLTHEDLARTSGFSISHFSKIMAFGRLPKAAHKILKDNPSIIGAAVAQDLAAANTEGKSERIAEAIELIAHNKLPQGQALKHVMSAPRNQPSKPPAEEIKIKKGKAVFCNLRRAQKVIRLEFRTDEEAEHIQQALLTVLEESAKSSN